MKYRIVGADGKIYGPVDLDQLRRWLSQGRVDRQTWVYGDGAKDWTALGLMPEFASVSAPPLPVIGAVTTSAAAPTGTNGFATAGLVCSLLSWTCCCLPFNIFGVIFCVIALIQISSQPVPQQGRALAVVGLCLSIASIVFFFVLGTVQILANPGTVSWQSSFQ